MDVARFEHTIAKHKEFFGSASDVVIARAPGRLDVMGGIADYSGSLVLQLPLAVATCAAAVLSHDRALAVRSLCASGVGGDDTVTVPIDTLLPGGAPLDYSAARVLLATTPARRWAAYV